MPRSGRSILPPCQHRGDPLRLRPLATLDGAAVAAQQSTHQTTPYSHRSRRARHPNGDETTLALAPSARRRQRTSPTQRRNRVVHRPQLKTLCLGVVTQRHAGSACPLQCFHRLSLLLRQRLVHRVPHFPQVHCPQSAHDGRTSFFKRLRPCRGSRPELLTGGERVPGLALSPFFGPRVRSARTVGYLTLGWAPEAASVRCN